jgi:hypothetical protein
MGRHRGGGDEEGSGRTVIICQCKRCGPNVRFTATQEDLLCNDCRNSLECRNANGLSLPERTDGLQATTRGISTKT